MLSREDHSVYPLRDGVADCQYYLKTGKCNYGTRCKFNHPHRDQTLLNALNRRDCFDYVQTGSCPYGTICKYNHPAIQHPLYSIPSSSSKFLKRSLSEPPSTHSCLQCTQCTHHVLNRFHPTNTPTDVYSPIQHYYTLSTPQPHDSSVPIMSFTKNHPSYPSQSPHTLQHTIPHVSNVRRSTSPLNKNTYLSHHDVKHQSSHILPLNRHAPHTHSFTSRYVRAGMARAQPYENKWHPQETGGTATTALSHQNAQLANHEAYHYMPYHNTYHPNIFTANQAPDTTNVHLESGSVPQDNIKNFDPLAYKSSLFQERTHAYNDWNRAPSNPRPHYQPSAPALQLHNTSSMTPAQED